MRGGSGQLRHRVQIQTVTQTRDAHGGNTEGWATTDTVWAAVEPLSGHELYVAQQVHARTTVRIRMRRWAGLTTRHRLVLAE